MPSGSKRLPKRFQTHKWLAVLSAGGVFRRRVRCKVASKQPLAVAATSPFPSIRLLASCWSSFPKTTQGRWTRSTAAAASQSRLGTASSPCPEPRAVPSLCCRSRTRLLTLRIGNALPNERCAPTRRIRSRDVLRHVGGMHRVTIERGCPIARPTVGQLRRGAC